MRLTSKVMLAMGLVGSGAWGVLAAPAPIQVLANEIVIAGKVVKVSPLRREIQIKAADGAKVDLKVSPEVAKLDEIKKGDQVEARYLESVAVSIAPAKADVAAPAVAEETVQLAPAAGTAPAAAIVNTAV